MVCTRYILIERNLHRDALCNVIHENKEKTAACVPRNNNNETFLGYYVDSNIINNIFYQNAMPVL